MDIKTGIQNWKFIRIPIIIIAISLITFGITIITNQIIIEGLNHLIAQIFILVGSIDILTVMTISILIKRKLNKDNSNNIMTSDIPIK